MATAAELAALRQRIANLLIGATCSRIHFRWGNIDFRSGGFVVVGMSLGVAPATRTGHGARRQMGVDVESMPAGVGAMYRAGPNNIVVPTASYGSSHDERMCLVHEATHAVFDYHRIRATALEEEACSYLAGAMFDLIENYTIERPAGSIFAVALDIARDFVMPTRQLRPWATDVSPAQRTRLISAVRHSSTYSHLHSHPSTRYPHNSGRI
jgi:hypothetical protein